MANKKVLICDDELYIQEAVQHVVRRAGFTPLLAQDGEESVTIAQKEVPDLVILDIMMPKRDGFEVCRLLRGHSKTKNIHIIMLTARGYDTDNSMSEKCGANEIITKPFSPRKLQQRLSEILGSN
jgi:DNA-binding response OmpR family regulator